MKKKNFEMSLKCTVCDYIPEKGENKSIENWAVHNTKCPKCGSYCKIEFIEEE